MWGLTTIVKSYNFQQKCVMRYSMQLTEFVISYPERNWNTAFYEFLIILFLIYNVYELITNFFNCLIPLIINMTITVSVKWAYSNYNKKYEVIIYFIVFYIFFVVKVFLAFWLIDILNKNFKHGLLITYCFYLLFAFREAVKMWRLCTKFL